MSALLHDLASATGEAAREIASKWWVPVLRGVLLIIVGTIALFYPQLSLSTIVVLCGITFAVDGVLSIIRGATSSTASGGYRALWVVYGVLSIIASIVTFTRPGILVLLLSFLLAFWLITSGIVEIVAAFEFKEGRVLRLILGPLTVIVGISLLIHPLDAVDTLAFVFGFSLVLMGVTNIAGGVELRSIFKKMSPSS